MGKREDTLVFVDLPINFLALFRTKEGSAFGTLHQFGLS